MLNKICFWLLSCLLWGWGNFAYADLDYYNQYRALIMKCDYSDYKSYQSESISIQQSSPTTYTDTQPASIKVFKRGSPQKTEKPFLIKSGEFAECIYPSGNRIRVKVGEGTSRPYGECGGDPEVFMSIWVNKRKIASQAWFTGRCEDRMGREYPTVSFNISNIKGVFIEKCHIARQQENIDTFISKISKQIPPKPPLSVCVDYPEISNFPLDFIEYPRKGVKLPKSGDIQLLKGSDKVCQAVRNELKADFFTFGRYPKPDVIKLPRPDWIPASVKLAEELYSLHESNFDFDNDGKLDRVFEQTFENNYMDGSVLLVQHGLSASKLNVSATPMDKNSSFFPCQMESIRFRIKDCPPFPNSIGEGNFLVKGKTTKDSVYFRGRYTYLSPFSFQGTTFIGINSRSEDTLNYAAVLKPLPNRKFQPVCLFKRVTEHF
jgi:hypothetical protein